MSEAIRQLEPRHLWGRFADLNAIPRASGKEAAVCAWITGLAQDAGLEVESDPVGNVLVRKPATPGMEGRKTVILQSHVDMVHQKNNDTAFDFNTEGIRMFVEGDWVKAEGTTLGADNGLGVATMLAVMESTDLPHPPHGGPDPPDRPTDTTRPTYRPTDTTDTTDRPFSLYR